MTFYPTSSSQITSFTHLFFRFHMAFKCRQFMKQLLLRYKQLYTSDLRVALMRSSIVSAYLEKLLATQSDDLKIQYVDLCCGFIHFHAQQETFDISKGVKFSKLANIMWISADFFFDIQYHLSHAIPLPSN